MDMMAPKLPAGKEGVGPGMPCFSQYFHLPQSHQYPRPIRVAQRRTVSKNMTGGGLCTTCAVTNKGPDWAFSTWDVSANQLDPRPLWTSAIYQKGSELQKVMDMMNVKSIGWRDKACAVIFVNYIAIFSNIDRMIDKMTCKMLLNFLNCIAGNGIIWIHAPTFHNFSLSWVTFRAANIYLQHAECVFEF